MELRVGRLALGQLDGRDAERPNVRLGVVGRLLDDLGRHPKRRADERVALGRRRRQLAGDAKVGQLHVAHLAEQDVGG